MGGFEIVNAVLFGLNLGFSVLNKNFSGACGWACALMCLLLIKGAT